ncbi:hypothetical protein [Streptomyces sp. NPDC096339]|uniref:hypothetical protein n=1 Tax=Streptomyces sp. NPDC096339 TaxID=3366086 RepID=UPI00380EEC92
MGAAILVIWPIFFLYALVMAGFCCLVGSKTSGRMGCLMAVGIIGLPFALCVVVMG